MRNDHGRKPLAVVDWLVEEGYAWYLTSSRHGIKQVNLCACPSRWCTREWTDPDDELCDQCRADPRCRP